MTDRERWAEAAPRIAMALCEAGYPSEFHETDCHGGGWRENVVSFLEVMPPDDVLMKAGEVCGVPDLVERLWLNREGAS